jgi:hypothetical protein
MRLREIKSELDAAIGELSKVGTTERGHKLMALTQLQLLKSGCMRIRSTGVLKQECAEILSAPEVISNPAQEVTLPLDRANLIVQQVGYLADAARKIARALGEITGPTEPNLLSVEIEREMDLETFSSLVKDLTNILNRATELTDERDLLEFLGTERGSIVLELIAGTVTLTLMGMLVTLAHRIALIKKDNEALTLEMERQKLANKILAAVAEDFIAQKEELKREGISEIVKFLRDTRNNPKEEEEATCNWLLTEVSSILARGAIFRPALTANSEVIGAFPVTNLLKASLPYMKLLSAPREPGLTDELDNQPASSQEDVKSRRPLK